MQLAVKTSVIVRFSLKLILSLSYLETVQIHLGTCEESS